ncbi:hypothetical protein [Planococcus sp. CAU13]|uniref:hypothetical protein n=1 Tax=Planococcus sp. CAU13 TaxID=1541197 RepID=UPI00052FE7FC|nr:hypothetical protein [Planococcus sp. CAU13]
MSNQVKGMLYLFAMEFRYSILVFWSILLSILLVFLLFCYYVISPADGSFFFGFPFAIYFYCGVLGFMAVKEIVPFALKIGATRRNYYIAAGLFFLGLSAFFSFAANTIQSLVTVLIDGTRVESMQFIHLANFLGGTWVDRFVTDLSVMFLLMTILFLTGLVFYKYGQLGGGILIGLAAAVVLAGVAQGWLIAGIIELFADINILFFYQVLLLGLILYALSFVMLRDISITKRK